MTDELTVTVTRSEKRPVKYLRAECGVRYWEDAKVDDVADEDGDLIPCRDGDYWKPLIDLETGAIEGWPHGTVADIHYKVCDNGRYTLLDVDRNVVVEIDGYVPKIMSPGGDGWGDYVIMTVHGDGSIMDWRADLKAFSTTPDRSA